LGVILEGKNRRQALCPAEKTGRSEGMYLGETMPGRKAPEKGDQEEISAE